MTSTLGTIYVNRLIGTSIVLENSNGYTLTIDVDPTAVVNSTLLLPTVIGNVGDVLTIVDISGTTAWQAPSSGLNGLISTTTLGGNKSGYMVVKDGTVDDRKCRLTTAVVKEGITGLDIESLNITTDTISNTIGDINISTVGNVNGKTSVRLGSNDSNTEFAVWNQNNIKVFSVDGAGIIYPASGGTGNWIFTDNKAGITGSLDLIELANFNVTIGSKLFTYTADPNVSLDSDVTYTPDTFTNELIVRSGLTQSRTDTFPAANLLVAYIGGVKVGTSFMLRVVNSSAKNITFSTGVGCIINNNSLIIGPNVTLTAHVRITNINVGSEAYTVQVLSRSGV